MLSQLILLPLFPTAQNAIRCFLYASNAIRQTINHHHSDPLDSLPQ
jgi:hypothetical protein